jgi:hypothetical protein
MNIASAGTSHERKYFNTPSQKCFCFGVGVGRFEHHCVDPLTSPVKEFLQGLAQRFVGVRGCHELNIASPNRLTHPNVRSKRRDSFRRKIDDVHTHLVFESCHSLFEIAYSDSYAGH